MRRGPPQGPWGVWAEKGGGGGREPQANTGRSDGALAWGGNASAEWGHAGGGRMPPPPPVLRAPPLSTISFILFAGRGASTAQLRNYSVEGGLGVGDGRFALGWAVVGSPADPLDMCL